jgi:hypothetical protein
MDYRYIADVCRGVQSDSTHYLRVKKWCSDSVISDSCLLVALRPEAIIGSGFASYTSDVYGFVFAQDIADAVANIIHAAEREFGIRIANTKVSNEYVLEFISTMATRINTVFALNGVLHKRNANEHTMCT